MCHEESEIFYIKCALAFEGIEGSNLFLSSDGHSQSCFSPNSQHLRFSVSQPSCNWYWDIHSPYKYNMSRRGVQALGLWYTGNRQSQVFVDGCFLLHCMLTKDSVYVGHRHQQNFGDQCAKSKCGSKSGQSTNVQILG